MENLIGDNHKSYTLAAVPPAVIWSFFRNSTLKGFRMFMGIALFANAMKFNGDTGGLMEYYWGKEKTTPGAWTFEKRPSDIFASGKAMAVHHSGSDWLRGKHDKEGPIWKQFEEK